MDITQPFIFIHQTMKIRRLISRIIKRKKEPEKKIVSVHFDHLKSALQVQSHQSILAIANAHDIEIPHYCGGCCRCGTCSILVIDGNNQLSKPKGNEELVLGVDKFQKGHRLACQAHVLGDVTIHIPDWF